MHISLSCSILLTPHISKLPVFKNVTTFPDCRLIANLTLQGLWDRVLHAPVMACADDGH